MEAEGVKIDQQRCMVYSRFYLFFLFTFWPRLSMTCTIREVEMKGR